MMLNNILKKIASVLLLMAMILMALTSLSVPVIMDIPFLVAKSDWSTFTIGIWGACNRASQLTCSPVALGFNLENLEGGQIPGEEHLMHVLREADSVSYFLVFHPIAAVGLGIAALLLLCNRPRWSFYACGFAMFKTLFAFLFDLWLFVQARAVINSSTTFEAKMGNGVWMTLSSLVMLTISMICLHKIGDGPTKPPADLEAGEPRVVPDL